MSERSVDLICLGRVAVDLYGQQVGGRLEDMSSFAKYLGGSSGNVAFGTARLGLKTSMLSRVGDEHLGRFLREELEREGVDTSHLKTDPDRLTALVVLGIRGDGTSPHIFYRERCADMAIAPGDFTREYIASSKALAITGTHLSRLETREACVTALAYAQESRTTAILDVDYRPVLWGLAGHGEGDGRFVASAEVTARLQELLPRFDLVVGTEEELQIAGGTTDTLDALRRVREHTGAVLVLKRGAEGCVVFDGAIPSTLEEGIVCPPFRVPVLNTLGAGDGFLSGFLRGFLRGLPLDECGRLGNACGALVVSREACAPAMPTWPELEDFLARRAEVESPAEDERLRHLHRMASRHRRRWDDLCILAFDHRSQLEDAARGAGRDVSSLPKLKELILTGALEGATACDGEQPGIILDDRYGAGPLARATGRGLFVARPIELPGTLPLTFEGRRNVALTLRAWPEEHVVKCLVRYGIGQDGALRTVQEDRLLTLYEACVETGHELLVEVIPPDGDDAPLSVPRSLARLYDLGLRPDWWKLPRLDDEALSLVAATLDERDPDCRGVLLLGLDAPEEELAESFRAARACASVRGFAVGRTIFRAPAEAWLTGALDDEGLAAQVAERYRRLIEAWRAAKR